MSVGSAPSGQADVEAAVGRLELRDLERAVRVVALRRREVDEQVGPVADAEVVEPDRPLAGRRLDQRRRAPAEVEVVGAVELAGARRRRRPTAWASARAPASARRLRTARRGHRRAWRSARASRAARSAAAAATGGSTSSVRIQIGDRRYHATGANTTSAATAAMAAGHRVAARDRRPVVAAREEEHADDRRGAQRHREVAVVVEEGEQAAAKITEDRHGAASWRTAVTAR